MLDPHRPLFRTLRHLAAGEVEAAGLCVERLRDAVREADICESGLFLSLTRLFSKSNSVEKACHRKKFQRFLVSSKDIDCISE